MDAKRSKVTPSIMGFDLNTLQTKTLIEVVSGQGHEPFNSTYVERKCFLCGKKYQAEGITNWTSHVMSHAEQLKSYITLSIMRGDSRKEFWETYLGKLNYITLFGSSK